jgi:putative protease
MPNQGKPILSPHDLAALPVLSKLIASGVHAFKIEGRLKPPEYVAEVTRIYREAIDHFAA